MNQTLRKLRTIVKENTEAQDSQLHDQATQERLGQLAEPLIQAFRDVEREFVRIGILQQIWPRDYDRRDDRISGLLVSLLGPKRKPYGLKIAVPYGFLRFEVGLKVDGHPVFICIRDTEGQRPVNMEFAARENWLEFFYKSIADLIEL